MATRMTATYANGAFAPDGEVDLPEGAKAHFVIGDWFEPSLPDGSPLAAAQREFELAFANVGWDEARVREGSRLAWEAARASVARTAKARGWAHETDDDLLRTICEMDGTDEHGNFEGKLRYYSRYRAAEIFRDRANAGADEISPILLTEFWQFTDGLRMTSALIDALASGKRNVEASE